MTNHAVFFDRDGTINEDTGYLGNPDEIIILPGVKKGLKKLQHEYGFKIIVISNQSGITRGLISEEDVEKVNLRINEILNDDNVKIDAFYYCPYHPDYDDESLTVCRKPSPYMIQKAEKEMNIDLKKSYMVGDKASDVISGLNAGTKSVLIDSKFIEKEINNLKNEGKSPNFVADNFLDAVNYIIEDFTRR